LTDNAPGQSAPDTIVLVHGFWVTPLSWEKWVKRYEAKGYRVLTPTCPGFEGGVEALREDPSPIEALTFPAVVEHIGGIIDGLEKPPIIIGHSAGGVLTQILLDHGYGAAGVAIDSVPAEGVKVVPVSQIRSLFPILKSLSNRHKAVGLTPEQSGTTPSPTPSAARSQTRPSSATTYPPRAGSCGWGPPPTSRPAIKRLTWTSRTRTARRCCS